MEEKDALPAKAGSVRGLTGLFPSEHLLALGKRVWRDVQQKTARIVALISQMVNGFRI